MIANISGNITASFETDNRVGLILFWYLSIVTVIGALLNAVVVFTILQSLRIKKVSNMYIFLLSMAFVDFITCVTAYPLASISTYHGVWQYGDVACSFYGFMCTLAGMNTINQLTALSVERYVVMNNALKASMMGKKSVVWCIMASLTLISLIYAVLPFTGWTSYKLEGIQTSCSVDWTSSTITTKQFAFFLLAFGFALPSFIQLLCNFKFLKLVHQMKVQSIATAGRSSRIAADSRKQEIHLSIMIASMIISFHISWLPYAVVTILALAGHPLTALQSTVPAYFAKSSLITNPLIYCFITKPFRKFLCEKQSRAEYTEAVYIKGPEGRDVEKVRSSEFMTDSQFTSENIPIRCNAQSCD